MDLLPYMPQVQALQRDGMTFNNYFVSDSLCCPSRSSIFTGDFPHDTGVFTNAGPGGGLTAFYSHGDENRTFNLALQSAGYRTAMMGKYLNGYLEGPRARRSPIPPCRPDGPSGTSPAGATTSSTTSSTSTAPSTTTATPARLPHRRDRPPRRPLHQRSAASGKPFFLELATFAPHTPYVPAPRDADLFPGLMAPRPPSFDAMPADPPSWLAGHPPLDRARSNASTRLPPARAGRAGRRRHDRPDPGRAAAGRAGQQHLHRVQLRQRPAHGRVPADARAS